MKKTIYISKSTNEMLQEEIFKATRKWELYYNIPQSLLEAIIKVESAMNPFAIRIEPHLKKVNWYKRALYGIENIRDYHYCSFGLMQIMFATARAIGFRGKAFELMNPDTNIKYGAKFLKGLLKRYKGNLNSVEDAISAYNQGNNRFYDINKNGIKDKDEKYRNQDYVNKVMENYLIKEEK